MAVFYAFSLLLLLLPATTPSTVAGGSRYDAALQAVSQSLRRAREAPFHVAHLNATLNRIGGRDFNLCLQMTNEAADYLDTVRSQLSTRKNALGWMMASRVRSLTSAALANIHTCLDDMKDAAVDSGKLYNSLVETSLDQCETLGLINAAMNLDRRPKIETGLSLEDPYGSNRVLQSSREEFEGKLLNQVPANQTVVVALDGTGNFSSIQEAINFAPKKPKEGYFKIVVKEGVYHENVVIKNKNLILIGDGINRTFISGNRSRGGGCPSTYLTATVAVHGEQFIGYNITFVNTAGPENDQAVALLNTADLSVFYQCSFLGYQDTLYAHSKTQFYRDCDIYGTVDFIFGNAAAVFQGCNIYARKPGAKQKNVVTAQGRRCKNDLTGFSLQNCTITAAPDLAANVNVTKTFLGRPWKKYSRAVYMQSFMDGLIDPVGWLPFNGTFALDTLFYGEFQNIGPSSDTKGRVDWPGYHRLDDLEAYDYTVDEFIFGSSWLPETHVPHFNWFL